MIVTRFERAFDLLEIAWVGDTARRYVISGPKDLMAVMEWINGLIRPEVYDGILIWMLLESRTARWSEYSGAWIVWDRYRVIPH